IARGLERTGEALRVVHVHLAAEGAHLVGARSGLPVLRGGVEQRHGADSLRRARRAEVRYRTASGRVTCATFLATRRCQRKRTEPVERCASASSTAARTVLPE